MTDEKNNLEAEIRQVKEDTLARNHMGYFKLWKMKLTKEQGGWSYPPWGKDCVIGIFPTRGPCEAFLKMIEYGPEVTYEFVSFNTGIENITGWWEVTIDKKGEALPNKNVNNCGSKWDWGWSNDKREDWSDYEKGGSYHGGEKFTGRARDRKRALEIAREYKLFYEEWVRTERPKRVEGCQCEPNYEKPCFACEEAEITRKKKDCGCPNCEGDHNS